MDVDPQFRQSQIAAQKRKRQRHVRTGLVVGGGIAGAAALVGLALLLLPIFTGNQSQVPASEEDAQITQVETETATPAVRLATPFADIPGDPMILRFENGDENGGRTLAGPATLDPARFGAPAPGRFNLLVEDLVVRENRLMTALPSSREDFAFFQAQRGQSLAQTPSLPTPAAPLGDGETVTITDDDNSWGDALGEGSATEISYVDTQIQNTTSIAFVRREGERQDVSTDLVVRLIRTGSLQSFLTDNGFTEVLAKQIDETAQDKLPDLAGIIGEDGLPVDTIVAVRYRVIDNAPIPLQVAIYGPGGYVGTLARRGFAGYVLGSNPWINADLTALAAPDQGFDTVVQDYRLLDAVYSAAIRSGVPTNLVGELIVMLSQSYDLEAVAAPGDKVTLLYVTGLGDGPGQIAYAAINGPSGNMPCYVAAKGGKEPGFGCYNQRGLLGAGSAAAFVTPVNGTLSSPYGPRFHPILKEVRLHGGVDWAAPTGTPILAAQDGTFAVVGNGGGYGKVVYINHADGLQSRYAHMDGFAPNAIVGKQVQAGEVIGYVGTTGRSTGPHLHFEFRKNGAPIDPFSLGNGGAAGASSAVAALTDQIIKVESAGNTNAKNPLSTATGLGQFIESTWLRMMRDYRPDLAGTMSREELLALRVDPTISREMVQNLARENENFLRARGHRIDAGRLYLSHFLGPAGAHRALSSADDQTVLAVMGASVVGANPFLRNYTIADLKAWAQRKMRGAGGGSSAPPVPIMSAEVRAYIATIDTLLGDDT